MMISRGNAADPRDRGSLFTAGLAGLVAGAVSMAGRDAVGHGLWTGQSTGSDELPSAGTLLGVYPGCPGSR